MLLDAGLPCQEDLALRVGAIVARLFKALARLGEARDALLVYSELLAELQLDHLGSVGTCFLLSRLGVHEAPASFCRASDDEIRNHVCEGNEALRELSGAQTFPLRYCTLAEYCLQSSSEGSTVRGSFLCEEDRPLGQTLPASAPQASSPAAPPLQAVPTGGARSRADRTLCGEFQVLEKLRRRAIETASNGICDEAGVCRGVSGEVRLFAAVTPCLSCVGAIRQFQLLFPSLSVTVASGECPLSLGWRRAE